MKNAGLLTFALALVPMTAMAGGPAVATMEPAIVAPVAPVIYAPSMDWSGFYSGVSLGYGKFTGGNDGQSSLAGIDLGYRHDFGMAVVGAELSYDKNNLGENSANDQINSTAGVKLLAGVDMGKTLVYASIGASQAEAQIGGVTATDNGYFGGIGMDYALTDKWTVGGEIQSHRYDNFNNSGVNLKDTSLEMKVGYKF